jgi:hypothetical protein
MKDQELIGSQPERGLRSTVITRELDFEPIRRQLLDDGSDLPSTQTHGWLVLEQRYDI